MTDLEIQKRVDALREEALSLAVELSRRTNMGYRELLAAEQMQNVANALGNVQRSASFLTSQRVSQAA